MRALALVALTLPLAALATQEPGVLHITATFRGGDGTAAPVARHALLISDNPATGAPRRVLTGTDGTVDVRLPPGSYIVESDQPASFDGGEYTWTEVVTIEAGIRRVLALTSENATAAVTSAAAPDHPTQRLRQWQDSVFAIWTPAARASGVLVDGRGLVITGQRAIGSDTAVHVQVSATVKVAARRIDAGAGGVAILRIDPSAVTGVAPLALHCERTPGPVLANTEEIFTIDAPLDAEKAVTTGRLEGGGRTPLADLRLQFGSAGGPVFNAAGDVVGISTLPDERDPAASGDARLVILDDLCRALTAAEPRLASEPAPSGAHLPVEPTRAFPRAALDQAAERPLVPNAYQLASADFDLAFLTPPAIHAARQLDPGGGRSPRSLGAAEAAMRARQLTDFGRWSEYVEDAPPVLLVRATPRLAEGFWATLARGAAMTQGVALPPIKQFKPGFARMQAFCGDVEVTPIQPFTLEWRISETDAIREGLYAFDPGALGPHCRTVRLVLYSEKTGERGDSRTIDPKIVQQVWQDFAPLRETP